MVLDSSGAVFLTFWGVKKSQIFGLKIIFYYLMILNMYVDLKTHIQARTHAHN